MEKTLSDAALRDLTTLIECDPTQCVKEACSLYRAEDGFCYCERVMGMLKSAILNKFKDRNNGLMLYPIEYYPVDETEPDNQPTPIVKNEPKSKKKPKFELKNNKTKEKQNV